MDLNLLKHFHPQSRWVPLNGWMLLLLLWSVHLQSQSLPLSFHNLTQEDGLTPAEHYWIDRDSRDFVWIGTDDGLLRFDGRIIRKYLNVAGDSTSLSENIITSRIFEDSQGNLWFTSFGAVNCYHRQSDQFSSYRLADARRDYHAFYLEDSQTLWLRIGLGDEGALYLFNLKNHNFQQKIALPGAQASVITNDQGEIIQLLSTALPDNSGLRWIDLKKDQQKQVDFLERFNGPPRSLKSPTRSSAYVDQEGTAWVGIYGGIGCYKPGADKGYAVLFSDQNLKDYQWVNAVHGYDSSQLIISADLGILFFDLDTKIFTQVIEPQPETPHGLKIKSINSSYLDAKNTLWVSDNVPRIAFADLAKSKFHQLQPAIGASVLRLQEDPEGNIWCSTRYQGILVFNQNQELLFRSDQLLNKANAQAFVTDLIQIPFFIPNTNSDWWANSKNYFFRWDKSRHWFEFRRSYFLNVASSSANQVNYCYVLDNGVPLVAYGNKLYQLQLTAEEVKLSTWASLEYLQLKTITILFEDSQNRLFIGDNDGRLVVVPVKSKPMTALADVRDVGLCYGFQEDTLRNRIWIATSNGLLFMEGQKPTLREVADSTNLLPREPFYNIVLDREGQLWLTGNSGLIRYQPDQQKVHYFTLADGLLSADFGRYSLIKASKTGELWLGSQSGVNIIKPESIELMAAQPGIQLTGLLVNDEAFSIEGNLQELTQLRLKYAQNTLSFRFSALDYSDPNSNQFATQLVGWDEEKIPNGNQGFVRYSNLAAGSYIFKVWASNSDGIWNEQAFTLNLRIIPPFYQRWWFYLLCLVLISGIIYGIFQYRLQQALKMERLRVKISSDLHDDVGGLLSGLAMQSEILELTAKDEVKPKLRRIAELSRSAMARMRDTVWAIDARKDKLENLIDRMREHAEETLTPKQIRYQIDVQKLDLKKTLPADIRQNLYLIYKEAVTNAAKHTTGDQVWIRLQKLNATVEMSIRDNGTGNSKDYKTTGLGLSNMSMRAKQIGGHLSIHQDKGYEVVLEMKGF